MVLTAYYIQKIERQRGKRKTNGVALYIWPKENCSINATSQKLRRVDGLLVGERNTSPLGLGLAESLTARGNMLQEIWGSVCPAAGWQVLPVVGGSELKTRKERDLGGSGRL